MVICILGCLFFLLRASPWSLDGDDFLIKEISGKDFNVKEKDDPAPLSDRYRHDHFSSNLVQQRLMAWDPHQNTVIVFYDVTNYWLIKFSYFTRQASLSYLRRRTDTRAGSRWLQRNGSGPKLMMRILMI